MKKTFALFFVGLSLFLNLSFPKDAHAVPAFARKYNVPCTLCHVAFPKLNDFGNIFRDNGYQMGSESTDLPEKHSEGFWPVSFRTTAGFQSATISHQPTVDGTLGTGHARGFGFTGLDVLAFGTLGPDISFSVVYAPGLEGAGFETGSTVPDSNLEAVWVRFDNLLHTPLLNLKIGKFELDMPFSEKRSLTLNSPYIVYHYIPGVPYTVNLTNTTNLPLIAGTPSYTNVNDFGLGENQEGVELMGHQPDGIGTFRYDFSVLSNAELHSDPIGGGGRQAQFYAHLTQSMGGWGATAGQRVGLFGFYGKAPTQNLIPTIQGNGSLDRNFYRFGGDLSLNFASLNLIMVYLHGWENGSLFCSTDTSVAPPGRCVSSPTAQDASWNGGFIEANYLFNPDLVLVYRYDIVGNQKQIDSTLPNDFNDVRSHTAVIRYGIWLSSRAEVWTHLEYNRTTTKSINADPSGPFRNVTADTVLAAIDFAF